MVQDNENEDQANEEVSFEEMLDQSFVAPERLEPGEQISAEIVGVSEEWIFLDLGGKSEGYLAKSEFIDEDGNLTVKTGETIQAYFLSTRNNEKLFTTKLSAGAAGQAHLENAFHNGIPIEGRVEGERKGGFNIKIAGGIRAFCPYSQMSLHRSGDPKSFIGQDLSFRILEYSGRGKNVVLSHRAILEEERKARQEVLKETLKEGMNVKGTITSIRDFGAFVDIGGLEGLIPISEIAWGRVQNIHEFVSSGQDVEVDVMKLDWGRGRFSFSLKASLPDPWLTAEEKYPEGSSHHGKVARLTAFGAFVTLEPGVDGLLHISSLGAGKKINHPREVVAEEEVVEVLVNGIDPEKRRLSLALASVEKEKALKAMEKEENLKRYASKKEKEEATAPSFGTFGDLLKTKVDEGQ
ncbi:MAG: 30S ribosomal protein S1 [Pseudomonadota bacterium]